MDAQPERRTFRRFGSNKRGSSGFTSLQLKLLLKMIEAGKAGVMSDDLIVAVYDDPDGGPQEAQSTLSSLRRLINKKLYPHRLQIIAIREGRRSRWKFAEYARR